MTLTFRVISLPLPPFIASIVMLRRSYRFVETTQDKTHHTPLGVTQLFCVR